MAVVTVMAMPEMAMPEVAVVAMVPVVLAVMAMTTAMSTTVPAAVPASRRGARGGERRDGEDNSSSSGSEDLTVHYGSPCLIQSDHRPGLSSIGVVGVRCGV